MTPARRNARAAVWILFALVLFVRFAWFRDEPQPRPQNRMGWQQGDQRFRRPPTPVRPPAAEVPADLPRLRIQIEPQDVETLRGYYWNGFRGQRPMERPEVLATVREGDTTYTNVAVHLKGAAGSFRPFDDKPALTLNFSKHVPGRKFHNFSKISLNNSVQDPTFICEALCRELYNQAGVPAPEAAWATVVLNDRDLGLYVMIEGYGKDFLRRHFKNVKGNLYDSGFVQDIDGNLAVNSGDHPDDHSDLRRLSAAASQGDLVKRWEQLEQVLDMDRFITLVAMEIMLCHWDGYALNRNNYRVFHDMDTDRMVFMPHGMDQMFDYPPGRFPPEGQIHVRTKGKVAAAVLSTPRGNRLYLERMDFLRTNVFKEEAVIGRVQEMALRLTPTLRAYSPSVAQWHEAAVASLCDRIQRRIRSVSEQLAQPREPLHFNDNGKASVTNWVQNLIQGGPLRMEKQEADGRSMLGISAMNRGGSGSWRSRANLKGGRYRFEGRVKASPTAVGSTATLRLSGDRPEAQSITGTDWLDLSYTFTVEGVMSEVVLVCEFSGAQGEVWFDLESLKLVRE